MERGVGNGVSAGRCATLGASPVHPSMIDAPMSALDVRLLGELAVFRDGVRIGLPASRKTRALLAYLAVTGKPQSRVRLCHLLWDGPVDPRGELRWSLSRLRSSLGEGVLSADTDSVGLVPGAFSTDLEAVAAFDPALVALAPIPGPRLAEVDDLFSGELVAGLDLPDCFAFQAWLVTERERVAGLRSSLLAALAARLDEDCRLALRAARSWLAHEPLNEAAHVALVRALRHSGRTKEAAAQLVRSRALLLRELGMVSPDLPAALDVRPAGVKRKRDATLVASPAGRRESFRTAFVGRQLALAEAAAFVGETTNAGSLLLVRGESGIGKSRFLSELADRLGGDGEVATGRAFEAAASRPYAPWIDLMRGGWAAEVGGAAPDREELFARVSALLARRCEARRLTVLLDDLQWADEASIALLHQLLGSAGDRLRFVGALRLEEAGRDTRVAALLRDLARDCRLRVLELGRLADADVERLVAAIDPSIDAAEVARRAAGHPLYATELARSGGVDLPASLAVLIGERLAGLSGDARTLVTWAAVWGTSVDAAQLERSSGLDPRSFLAAWEELEASRILVSLGDDRLDLAHDLVRRVAYEQIPPARRAWLHRQIAQSLMIGSDRDPAARARHAALSGATRDAAEAQLEAAEAALRLAANDAAESFVERGLGFAARLDAAGDDVLRLQLELLRVLVHARRGRPGRIGIEEEVRRLVDRARDSGQHAETQIGLYLLAVLDEERGDLPGAERRVLEAAVVARSSDPATAARALANTGRCLAQIEREPERAEALLLEARELEAQLQPLRVGGGLLDIPWGLALVAHGGGREDEARREFGRALDLARAAGDAWAESQCLLRLAALEIEAGHEEEALRCLDRLEEVGTKLGEGSEVASARALRALLRDPEALDDALDELRRVDAKGVLAYVLNEAARRDIAAGDSARAERRAGEALQSATTVGRKAQMARARDLLARLPARPPTPASTPSGETRGRKGERR